MCLCLGAPWHRVHSSIEVPCIQKRQNSRGPLIRRQSTSFMRHSIDRSWSKGADICHAFIVNDTLLEVETVGQIVLSQSSNALCGAFASLRWLIQSQMRSFSRVTLMTCIVECCPSSGLGRIFQGTSTTSTAFYCSLPSERLYDRVVVSAKNTSLLPINHGVYPSRPATEAEGVQVLWCGPQLAVSLCPEAILHTCCHQVFSNVHGVSISDAVHGRAISKTRV